MMAAGASNMIGRGSGPKISSHVDAMAAVLRSAILSNFLESYQFVCVCDVCVMRFCKCLAAKWLMVNALLGAFCHWWWWLWLYAISFASELYRSILSDSWVGIRFFVLTSKTIMK